MASSKARESDFSSKLEKENEKQSQAAETSKDADDPDKNTIDVGFFLNGNTIFAKFLSYQGKSDFT